LQEAKARAGKEVKARGLLQVLTINTLGPDEEDVRRGCVSHDMEPQGAGSSTTETLPAFGSLPRLTLCSLRTLLACRIPPLPNALTLKQALPYDTIHSPDAPSMSGLSSIPV